MATVSVRRETRLAEFAAGFSRRIEAQIAHVEQQAKAKAAAEKAVREREDKARAEEERREKKLKAKRIELARIGLARLIATGRSAPMQKVIAALHSLGGQSIEFYRADRYTGDAWFFWEKREDDKVQSIGGVCEVAIDLHQDMLFLQYGTEIPGKASGWTTWEVFYSEPPQQAVWAGGTEGKAKEPCSLDAFLENIATAGPVKLSVVAQYNQRTYAWEPRDVLFQVLVSCAQQAQFDRYLTRALGGLEKRIDKKI